MREAQRAGWGPSEQRKTTSPFLAAGVVLLEPSRSSLLLVGGRVPLPLGKRSDEDDQRGGRRREVERADRPRQWGDAGGAPGGGDAESNIPNAPARPNLAELVGPRRSG